MNKDRYWDSNGYMHANKDRYWDSDSDRYSLTTSDNRLQTGEMRW